MHCQRLNVLHDWWLWKLPQVAGCRLHPAATAHLSTGLLMWRISMRLQPAGARAKNDWTLSCQIITHTSARVFALHRFFFLGLSVLPGHGLCRDVHTLNICMGAFSLGRGVSVSCAHTQATLWDDYFSCLTQIAHGVSALRGYAQQLSL